MHLLYRTHRSSWKNSSKTSSKRRREKTTISQEARETKEITVVPPRTAETETDKAKVTVKETATRILRTNVKFMEVTSGANAAPIRRTRIKINETAADAHAEAIRTAGITHGMRVTMSAERKRKRRRQRSAITTRSRPGRAMTREKRATRCEYKTTISVSERSERSF